MYLENIIKLLLRKNKLGFVKEKENLEKIFSNLEFNDEDLIYIEASGRKNCIYTKLDQIIKEFCAKIELDVDEFMKILSILTIIDSYYSCYFLKYEINKNIINLDKLIGNKSRYLTKVINLFVFNIGRDRLVEVFNIEDEEILSNFLCDLILIRHSFLSSYFEYNFDTKWKIKFKLDILEIFWKLNYINYDVRYEDKIIKLKKEPFVKNIIENSSFNSNLWIYKFNLIKKNVNKEKEIFLNKENKGIFRVIKILNFMNNCKFHINKKVLESIIDRGYVLNKLERENRFMTLLSIKEASYIGNLEWFKFDYILDNRTRIYIKNIPLNPQLEKILRPVIINKIQNNEAILKKYIKLKNDFKLELNQIFSILVLDVSKKEKLINFMVNNFKLKKINKKELELSIFQEFLNIELIFAQQVYDVIIRLEIKIDDGIYDELINKINVLEDLEDIGFVEEMKNWIKNDRRWIESMWYNDASSNVLQILLLKLFIKNNKALEVCNIFDNKTNSKDIYEYILEKINNEEIREFISRKLIKKIVMPGLYGQTFISLKDQFNDIHRENDKWINLDKKEKNELILKIEKKVWKEISNLGINISDYLTLLKRLPYETEKLYWENNFDMPIILDKERSINRGDVLKKIKRKLINKEEGVTKLKEILNKDDSNYLRKNIKLGNNKYIKIRFKLKSNQINKRALSNALTPSTNHADDASILFKTLELCMKYEIECIPIHDSIGAMIYYSSLIKILFKLSNIQYLENLLQRDRFPFDILREVKFKNKILDEKKIDLLNKRDINKQYYLKNKNDIYKKILESKNFFK